jgi:hypothetical protein
MGVASRPCFFMLFSNVCANSPGTIRAPEQQMGGPCNFHLKRKINS